MKRLNVRGSQDEGAILIFALIIITTVALVTGVVLAKGWSNFAATVSLRNVAGQAYAADDAAKIAINDIVYGGSSTVPSSVATYPNGANGSPSGWVFDNNTDGTGCFGKSTASGNPPLDRITLSNVYPAVGTNAAQTATVVCTPVAGTGLFSSSNGLTHNPPDPNDAFSRALTTVGTSTGPCIVRVGGGSCSDGVTLKGLGSGTEIPLRGSIESNTFVNVLAGTLRTNGIVTCSVLTGSIITSAGTTCSGSYVPPTDPGSPLGPALTLPAWQNPTTQGCDFRPGYYDNGALLTTWTSAAKCPGGVHFRSGTYYFDFNDGNPWEIDNRVIGGELVSPAHSIPGACVDPINNWTTPGVQFVFGGDSYIQADDTASVELCAPGNNGSSTLALYQQQTSVPTSPVSVPAAASNNVTTTATSPTNDSFTTGLVTLPLTLTLALSGTTAPNTTADWLASKNGDTGELDLQDFAGLSSIPAGSTITSAKLNVTYTPGLSASGTFTASVAGQSGTVPVAASGTNTDITSLLNAKLGSGPFTSSNPTIQLQVSGKKNDTMSVDAVTLAVTYKPASIDAATTGTFITDHGGNFQGQFVVEGSTFAPNGYITLTPGSSSTALVAFRWGVVAWGVSFKSQPSQVWGYPLISIPDIGSGPNPVVDLKVFLCTGAGPCSTTGTPSLATRVQFTDGKDANGIFSPVAGQRQVQVLSWAEQR